MAKESSGLMLLRLVTGHLLSHSLPIITFEDHAGGTRYTARALHKDEADRKTHEKMGFHEGWALCFEQLVEVAKQLKH